MVLGHCYVALVAVRQAHFTGAGVVETVGDDEIAGEDGASVKCSDHSAAVQVSGEAVDIVVPASAWDVSAVANDSPGEAPSKVPGAMNVLRIDLEIILFEVVICRRGHLTARDLEVDFAARNRNIGVERQPFAWHLGLSRVKPGLGR